MARVKANTDFDAENADELLNILENLSRDIGHIEQRQKRLSEHGVTLQLKTGGDEIIVELKDA